MSDKREHIEPDQVEPDSVEHTRLEVDREDLLAEATALVVRAEIMAEGFDEPIVVGFRRQGCASVYFGADPAYHFNTAGALRRAYCGSLLYKADGGRLSSLERRRTGAAVELVRRDLDGEEQQAFLARLTRKVTALGEAVQADRFAVRGQVSPNGDAIAAVRKWLAGVALPPAVAMRANFG
jgi:hypothetical protein